MKAIGNEIRHSSLFICHECSRLVLGDAGRRHFCASSDFLLGVIAGMSGESKTDTYMVLGLSSFDLERLKDQDFCDGYVVGSDIADTRWSHAEIEAQRRLVAMVARMTSLNVERFAETPVGQALRQVAFSQGRDEGIKVGTAAERLRLETWAQRMRDWKDEQKSQWKEGRTRSIQGAEYRRIMSLPLDEVIALHESFQRRRAEA